MAITTYEQWKDAKRHPPLIYHKPSAFTTLAGVPYTMIARAGDPAAGTVSAGNTGGIVPTDATAGFPTIHPFGAGNTGYLESITFSSSVACQLVLYDLIFRAGGYNLTTLTTFNLGSPPSYLSRLPNGSYKGLEVFGAISNNVSAENVSVPISYTDENAVSGNSAVIAGGGSVANFTSTRMFPYQLNANFDGKGISELDSVTIAGTAATTGQVNIYIMRRLWQGSIEIPGEVYHDSFDVSAMPIIYDTSALFPVVIPNGTSTGVPHITMQIAEG